MNETNIKRGVYNILGARNYAKQPRVEMDFYSTDPEAVAKLINNYTLPPDIWECACGNGNISQELIKHGFRVHSTDIVDRGFGAVGNFFEFTQMPEGCTAIVTNPPYSQATEFILHALQLLPPGGVLAMFLKTQFIETQKRFDLIFSKNPPSLMLQFIKRVSCYRNDNRNEQNNAMPFCWLIWERNGTERNGTERNAFKVDINFFQKKRPKNLDN